VIDAADRLPEARGELDEGAIAALAANFTIVVEKVDESKDD